MLFFFLDTGATYYLQVAPLVLSFITYLTSYQNRTWNIFRGKEISWKPKWRQNWRNWVGNEADWKSQADNLRASFGAPNTALKTR